MRIEALGCSYLDAPVSGGEVGARQATLSIMCGGSQETFDRVKPLLETMGKNITLVGGNGAGQTCKVANQIVVALTIEAVGEALVFASRAGADRGESAPGAHGRPRRIAYSRTAWRSHDQAHVRSRLPHRTASEGPQPRALERASSRGRAAEYGQRPGACSTRARRMAARSGTTRGSCERSKSWPIMRSDPRRRPEGDGAPTTTGRTAWMTPLRAHFCGACSTQRSPKRTRPRSCRAIFPRRPRAGPLSLGPERLRLRWRARSRRTGPGS